MSLHSTGTLQPGSRKLCGLQKFQKSILYYTLFWYIDVKCFQAQTIGRRACKPLDACLLRLYETGDLIYEIPYDLS